MATTEQIKAALLAQKERSSGSNNGTARKARSTGDMALYPHWTAAIGDTVSLRFLPDADPENIYFWRERQTIRLTFQGIVGGEYPTQKEVEVTVPCVDMFDGMRCPIIQFTKSWWNDEKMKPLARKYWKKKSNIFQGFVVKSPIVEEEVPENPIRKFTISPQIFKHIYEALLSGDMPDPPCHLVGGREFHIKKTKQGEHNNFDTSGWSMAGPRSLGQAEMDAIETHSLWDLKQSLGAIPDAEHMAVIEAMFHASLNGDPFDVASFGQHYRAFAPRGGEGGGYQQREQAPAQQSAPAQSYSAPAQAAAPVQAAAPAYVAPAASSDAGPRNPADILAKIKARQAQ